MGVFDKIYPRLTKLFTNVPRTKLEVNETPSSEYPAAFYLAGTEDGSRPGKYSLNTFKFSSQPRYEMISLSLHEACPGHHLQGSYLLEKPGVARFRKAIEDRNYCQSPSRFPFYTASWSASIGPPGLSSPSSPPERSTFVFTDF